MYQECHRFTLLPGWAWIPQDPTCPLRTFSPGLGWEHEQEDASWITEDTEGRETSNPCPLWDPGSCNYRARFVEYSHFPPPSTCGGKYYFSLHFCCFQSPFVHSRPVTAIEGGGSEFEDNLVYKVSLWAARAFMQTKVQAH